MAVVQSVKSVQSVKGKEKRICCFCPFPLHDNPLPFHRQCAPKDRVVILCQECGSIDLGEPNDFHVIDYLNNIAQELGQPLLPRKLWTVVRLSCCNVCVPDVGIEADINI